MPRYGIVGLDAEASARLNDLYNRAEVGFEHTRCLPYRFELDFAHAAGMRPALAGRPVDNLEPQNML